MLPCFGQRCTPYPEAVAPNRLDRITGMANPEFDIHRVMDTVREAVRPYPPAAMFQLAEEGYRSLFEQLIACILSIRTYDEVSVPVSRRLFSRARTPKDMVQLSETAIAALIQDSTFADRKAGQIRTIAQQILTEDGGELVAEADRLTRFNGVGPKCAHLALGVALNVPCISVDIHVHRVTNRWGYVRTRSPEATLKALQKVLPQEYWVEINRLLVPFGKHICRGTRPRCQTCPVQPMCAQVGVRSPH